jgi:hypothetical protein
MTNTLTPITAMLHTSLIMIANQMKVTAAARHGECAIGWRRGVSDGYYGPDLSITTSVLLGYMWKQGLKAVSDAIAGAFPVFLTTASGWPTSGR